MRVIWLLVWILALAALVVSLLRRVATPRHRPAALSDELVKDPICQTYVVRSRAVARQERGEPVYFCSAECARRYAEATGA
jgi:YHS domain-containing protein